MATVVHDMELERRRFERHCEQELDDVQIVEFMVLVLAGHPPPAAASKIASMTARVAFFDIVRRWIPPAVVKEAFDRLEHEKAFDDAS
ncbi:MAG: hypothetical protein ACR2M2_01205 [Gaiellaceae bacterium]